MDGVVILGAEIQWQGTVPHPVRASIPWTVLQRAGKPYALALRVAPFAGLFAKEGAPMRALAETAGSLLTEAGAHGVRVNELQLDFDCAQRNLAGYRLWVRALRTAVHPVRLVLTALPSWLDEPAFPGLVREADGYVLQVHSVPTEKEGGRAVLCDPALARKWVAKAAKYGLPFSVALPTYRGLAGYGPAGKLLGVSMDGVQPAWPPGTRTFEFSSNADDLAGLVREWRTARPQGMKELLWYRVPVASDRRNWRWPTLSAVMAGRKPVHRLAIVSQGDNPVDFAVANPGEAEEPLDRAIVVSWQGTGLVAADALPGWTIRVEKERAVFIPEPGGRLRLPPGEQRAIGWLRHERSTILRSRWAGEGAPP